MEDPIKEVADLMENTKDEGWDKNLPNKQVTFVVYREGDQLNFFRVADRGDGSLTPLSESLRSVFPLFIYAFGPRRDTNLTRKYLIVPVDELLHCCKILNY